MKTKRNEKIINILGNTNIKLHINALLSVLLLYVVVYDFSNTVEYRTREQINRSYTWYTRPYEHNTRISSAAFGVWMNMPASILYVYSKHNVLSVLCRKKYWINWRSDHHPERQRLMYIMLLSCFVCVRYEHTHAKNNKRYCVHGDNIKTIHANNCPTTFSFDISISITPLLCVYQSLVPWLSIAAQQHWLTDASEANMIDKKKRPAPLLMFYGMMMLMMMIIYL
jgi:hypothetical protein